MKLANVDTPLKNESNRFLWLMVVLGVLLANLSAWMIGSHVFINDARELDNERSLSQVMRAENLLQRDALSLKRVVLGRADWLARELSEYHQQWDRLAFPEFVSEAFLLGANIDGYILEDRAGRVRYAVHYSRESDRIESLAAEEVVQMQAIMRHPANRNGFAGLQVMPNGVIVIVAGVPIDATKRLGWVVAHRDLDSQQLRRYGDLLGYDFRLHLDDGKSLLTAQHSARNAVAGRIADINGEKRFLLQMVFDHSYETHMRETVLVGQVLAFGMSLIAGISLGLVQVQRKAIRRREEHNRQKLERVARLAAVGELAAGVAHEINNPSGMIRRNLDFVQDVVEDTLPLLAEREDADDLKVGGIDFATARSELPQLFDDMTAGARRIGDIVRDLKDFTRDEPADEHARFALSDVASAAIRLLEGTIRKATLKLSYHAEEGLPPVAGSRRQIEQVVVNLLQNACQALESVDQQISLEVRYDQRRRQVVLVVADQGRGIAPEVVGRIFEPFFTTRRETGGTGLGLSVSLRIVRRHGGELDVESTPDQGTRMILRLPAAQE